jgi:hypothetical protein
MLRTALLSALALGLVLSRPAAADVAPPDDYVEECTIEKKQTPSSECLVCRTVRAMYDNSNRCTLLLSPYCFTSVCGAWGGASYPEVWCRTKAAEAPVVPPEVTAQLDDSTAPNLTGVAGSASGCAPYSPPASAGSTGAGGSTGGSSAAGGSSPEAGATATGGSGTQGGATAAGGSPAEGGSTKTAEPTSARKGSAAAQNNDDGGCQFSGMGATSRAEWWMLLGLAGAGMAAIRRRGRLA